MYGNGKIDWFWDRTLPKILVICQKVSNKSCWDFNYQWKTLWAHMSIFSWSRARGLERLPRSKYYNIWKWEKRLNLGWRLPQILTICKKVSNKSFWDLNYLQKTQWAHMSIFPWSGAMGLQRFPCSKYYKVWKWENKNDSDAERCQKYRLFTKKFQINVVEPHCYQQMRESLCAYYINKLILIIFEQKNIY